MMSKHLKKGFVVGTCIVLMLIYVTASFALHATKKENSDETLQVNSYHVQSLNGWEKSYGGTEHDYGCSIVCTNDGKYIIAGYTYSSKIDNSDALLIKIDENGKIVWEKTYGGLTDNYFYSADRGGDGGYIMAGKTHSYTYDSFVGWIVKVDENGAVQWEKTFGGKDDDCLFSIELTSDGGYVLAGHSKSSSAGDADIWLLKINADGDKEWENIWGGGEFDEATAITQTSDGGYVTVFYYESFGFNIDDDWLYKLNALGIKEWQSTFGGFNRDILSEVRQTRDGGYVILGATESFGEGSSDIWLIKTDENGNRLWDKTFGGASADYGYSVKCTNDGGYILAGSTESYGAGGSDAWVIQVNANGVKQWDVLIGGESDDYVSSVQETNDGGYILAGSTESYGAGGSDAWVIKMTSNWLPDRPSVSGMTDGFQWVKYTYETSIVDPEGDNIKFYFDWGDGNGNWTNFVASGENAYHSHVWDAAGTYQVKVKAQDESGGESRWSTPLQVVISPNMRPDKPDKPNGTVLGIPGEEYTYTTSASDGDENTIRYGWDWDGDKGVDEWTPFHPSGETIEILHSWDEKGDYEVSVITEDMHGARGEWSDPLVISMPKLLEVTYLLKNVMRSLIIDFLRELQITLTL